MALLRHGHTGRILERQPITPCAPLKLLRAARGGATPPPVQTCLAVVPVRRASSWRTAAVATVVEVPPVEAPPFAEPQEPQQQQQEPEHQEHELLLYRNQRGRVFRLRAYRPSDALAVVNLQTDSFFNPPGLPALRAIAYANFKAEVADSVRQKERTLRTDPDIFQVFIAEDVTPAWRELPAGLLPPDLWERGAAQAASGSPAGPTGSAQAAAAASADGASQDLPPLLFVVLRASELNSAPVEAWTGLPAALPAMATAGAPGAGPQVPNSVTRQQLLHPPRPAWDELLRGELVGTVEISLMYELEVLRHLAPANSGRGGAPGLPGTAAYPGAAGAQLPASFQSLEPSPQAPKVEQYAYLSSMAVGSSARRQHLAHALLHCAERHALQVWRQPDLALHVHDDNTPAVRLYQKYGFQLLDQDPSWKRLLGGRVRLLMHRPLPVHTLPPLESPLSSSSSNSDATATSAVSPLETTSSDDDDTSGVDKSGAQVTEPAMAALS